MCKGGHNFSFDWDPVGVNLFVECLAEDNYIFGILVGNYGLVVVVEPEVEFIKKVKTR